MRARHLVGLYALFLTLVSGLIPAGSSLAAKPRAAPSAHRVLPQSPLDGDLVSAAEGDTFVLRGADGRIWQIRIAAIDAPERKQPGSEAARKQLRGWLHGHEIRVVPIEFDGFGRVLGKVYVTGEDVGLAQVRDGMAWHLERSAARQPAPERARYASAQAAARKARRGLWRDPAPQEPWLFRSRQHQRSRRP